MVTGGDGAAQVHLAHRATATGGGTALQETSVCTEHSMTLLFSQLLICSVYVFGKKGANFVASEHAVSLCMLVYIGEAH